MKVIVVTTIMITTTIRIIGKEEDKEKGIIDKEEDKEKGIIDKEVGREKGTDKDRDNNPMAIVGNAA